MRRGSGAQAHNVRLPTLQVKPGAHSGLTGESGCGKSTLLEAIGLLLQPVELGRFLPRARRRPRWISRRCLPRMTSPVCRPYARGTWGSSCSGGLLPFLSVRDNISLPRRLLGMPADSAQVDRAVQALRLDGLLGELPQALSIGERQRVACVRAIAHEP